MSNYKTNEPKKIEQKCSMNQQKVRASKCMVSNTELKEAKIVSIKEVSEKRRLELINHIIKTTPSF